MICNCERGASRHIGIDCSIAFSNWYRRDNQEFGLVKTIQRNDGGRIIHANIDLNI